MRISGAFVLAIAGMMLVNHARPAAAVEEGQFVKKEGKWEYYSGEDPGLKYLISKALLRRKNMTRVCESLKLKSGFLEPNFGVDVNNGLNVRVGERFFLKLRLLAQARYSYATYNSGLGNRRRLAKSRNLGWTSRISAPSGIRVTPALHGAANAACNFSDTHGIPISGTTFLGRLIRPPGIKKAGAEERGSSMPTSPPGISHGRPFSSGNSASGLTAPRSVRSRPPRLRTI